MYLYGTLSSIKKPANAGSDDALVFVLKSSRLT